MNKMIATVLCLAMALILLYLPSAGCAEARDAQGRSLYLEIPYDTITPEGERQLLTDAFGDIRYNEYGKPLITDFGYTFYFTVNFRESLVGADRILLGREGDERAEGDALIALSEQDILQFVDMDAQLVQRYGEPNFRFFFTNAKNYHMKGQTRFMLAGSVWDAEQMAEICRKDGYLEAYTCWDNITLRLWINRLTDTARGNYSRLYLSFYSELYPKEPPYEIIDFPPVTGD